MYTYIVYGANFLLVTIGIYLELSFCAMVCLGFRAVGRNCAILSNVACTRAASSLETLGLGRLDSLYPSGFSNRYRPAKFAFAKTTRRDAMRRFANAIQAR